MKIRQKVMKRYLIPIFVVVLVLVSPLLSGCNSTNKAKIDELEKQVAALEKQIADKKPQTQTINKDVAEVLVLGSSPEVKDKQTLRFRLNSGDIVEGEVTTTCATGGFISSVKDPFGNILLQSKTRVQYHTYYSLSSGASQSAYYISAQVYPWRFSFIASTTGDYTLEASDDGSIIVDASGEVIPNALLKVVINP